MNNTPMELMPVDAPQAQAMTVATPNDLLRIALTSGASVETMERLMALDERWQKNEAEKAFVAAMAAFKADPPEILKTKLVGYKTKDGDFVGYSHATLGQAAEIIAQGLGVHGMSHRWDVKQDNGQVLVTCIVTHKQGHSERVTLFAPPDDSGKKNKIQQVASTVSYLQRYTLLAITGLASKDQDDDGGRVDDDPEPQQDTRPDPGPATERETPAQIAMRKKRHDEAAARLSESIELIKACIGRNDGKGAANEWRSLEQHEREALWLAPTKGGIFTTDEREYLLKKLPSAAPTQTNEDAAADAAIIAGAPK